MWFLQSRCGLIFTIINHNHNQKSVINYRCLVASCIIRMLYPLKSDPLGIISIATNALKLTITSNINASHIPLDFPKMAAYSKRAQTSFETRKLYVPSVCGYNDTTIPYFQTHFWLSSWPHLIRISQSHKHQKLEHITLEVIN